ncbi:phosphotransferase [Butyrivibrio sp. VCD2006]|uniref:phosphotransferase n=1 Tax=Butyrivibrio sp. VCD2006 TaxID=1280664 RepID=UPI00040509B8|nr:phosphotransferase [Butyrivibrio sp. VCD2006]
MALEKSVLNNEKMSLILRDEYGLHLIKNKNLALGSANCYKVQCEEGDFFFKEYQSDFTPDMVCREADITAYLISKDFPVAEFVKTKDGNSCIVYEGHVISVQNFIEGKSYLNDLPHSILIQSAKYLGKLHMLLKDYPMEKTMDYNWAKGFSNEAISQKFNRLLSSLDENKTDPNYERIRDDLIFKKKLLESIDAWKEYFKEVTYTSTHGDYTACQLICDEDNIKAVIDFSSAGCIPAVWEIMRSYIQSGGVSRDGSDFDIEDFTLYVKEYMKYAPLTKKDLEAMPYIYLFQLSQSSYGYKEYLITKSENKETLLDFAFWRTGICREIYQKANRISEILLMNY